MRSGFNRKVLVAAVAGIGVLSSASFVQSQGAPAAQQPVDPYVAKPRVIVTTDIGGDPDDQQSFVRYLLYANEFDTEALVAVGGQPRPEQLRERIAAYGKVRANLLLHAQGWPEESELLSKVHAGQVGRNLAQTGAGKTSAGSAAIAAAIERDDPRPLWITAWGGPNTIAQALIDLRAKHTPQNLARLLSNVRVYAISDQDDSGPWIRREFPQLFYIVNPSQGDGGQRFDQYVYATWQGIGGDQFFRHGAEGADFTKVSNEWLAANVSGKGPLGALYPPSTYIMEGDTPSYLGLINNGLASYRRPDWGGWGGRYNWTTPYGESDPIWSSGGQLNQTGINSQDRIVGADGRVTVSDQATIWRWRDAYQNELAARMDWTIRPFAQANHNPVAIVNGQTGKDAIEISAVVGQPIVLDAGRSSDPDGNRLTYKWFHYIEAGTTGGRPAVTQIAGADTARATVTMTASCAPPRIGNANNPPRCPGGVAHIVLAVTDNGNPALTSYRRVILNGPADPPRAP